MRRTVLVLLLGALLPAAAQANFCHAPDEGTLPYRRAVGVVMRLPETAELMERLKPRRENRVQFLLEIDRPVRLRERCWWTLTVIANGEPWRRYLVTPEGDAVLAAPPDPGK